MSSSLLIFVAALAVADSLPKDLRALANSSDAFADSIVKLGKETNSVRAHAELVHKVAANKTARELILDDMERTLKAGMPSASNYNVDDLEQAALKAGATYKTADLVAKKAELALKHQQASTGAANLTATEKAKLQTLLTASQDADKERDAAKEDLKAKTAKADRASAEYVEATRAHVRKFEDHVDELERAARRQEAVAKKAMRAAISEAGKAADAEMKSRKIGQETDERLRELAEEWAEGHEDAIESRSDDAGDDLERIYGPVKDLARRSLDVVERDVKTHRENTKRLLASGERVALLQTQPPAVAGFSFLPWAGGFYAVIAAGALLVVVSRKRQGSGLQQPLLS